MPSNFEFSADNGYSTDENATYLWTKRLRWITYPTRKLSRKEKKYNKFDKPFGKDNFTYDAEIETYICPMGEIFIQKKKLWI